MRIIVLRSFWRQNERQAPGSELDVPDELGRELIQMGKAAAADPKPVAAEVMTTQSAGALVSGKPADPAPGADGKTAPEADAKTAPKGKGGTNAA